MTLKSPDIPSFEPQDPFQANGEVEPYTDESFGQLNGNEKPHQEVPYRILRPEDREQYLHLTDDLVRQMIEQEVDTAIFLDKSARPVAWMVHELWEQLAPPNKPDGTPYAEPDIKFLNIDREQWGAIVGRSETGMLDISSIPEERINELRTIMSIAPSTGMSEDEPVPEAPSRLSGKRVMVVDEVQVSGDTLRISQRILNRAFPDAKIIPVAWMDGQVQVDPRSGQRTNTKLPVWYDERRVTGRGVGDRDTTRASHLHSGTSRIGRYWLSVPFKEPDTDGIQLRREVQQMARDLSEHRILYRPSPWKREIDSIEDRIKRLDGITPEQYKNLRATTRGVEDRVKRLGQLASAESESSK